MSFIKHPLRPSNSTQDNPLYYTYETTQSMAISFDVVNNAGAILVNSSDPNYYDNFVRYELINALINNKS